MSYNGPSLTAATFIAICLVLLQVSAVASMSCIACDRAVSCPTLPDDCEPTTRPCGCCPECAGKVGADCSGLGLNCESGLMCVSDSGIAMAKVSWNHFNFNGKCREVEMCRVVEGAWYSHMPSK
ncbi:hypothetical protein LSAT2_007680 [Lamellibrachia satsuma]|nr:hypothetical protein LSAT2_007680 [Lamellibrachia satsuma]